MYLYVISHAKVIYDLTFFKEECEKKFFAINLKRLIFLEQLLVLLKMFLNSMVPF
jgi:hypothetical protein